jgi:hypothetical protein
LDLKKRLETDIKIILKEKECVENWTGLFRNRLSFCDEALPAR